MWQTVSGRALSALAGASLSNLTIKNQRLKDIQADLMKGKAISADDLRWLQGEGYNVLANDLGFEKVNSLAMSGAAWAKQSPNFERAMNASAGALNWDVTSNVMTRQALNTAGSGDIKATGSLNRLLLAAGNVDVAMRVLTEAANGRSPRDYLKSHGITNADEIEAALAELKGRDKGHGLEVGLRALGTIASNDKALLDMNSAILGERSARLIAKGEADTTFRNMTSVEMTAGGFERILGNVSARGSNAYDEKGTALYSMDTFMTSGKQAGYKARTIAEKGGIAASLVGWALNSGWDLNKEDIIDELVTKGQFKDADKAKEGLTGYFKFIEDKSGKHGYDEDKKELIDSYIEALAKKEYGSSKEREEALDKIEELKVDAQKQGIDIAELQSTAAGVALKSNAVGDLKFGSQASGFLGGMQGMIEEGIQMLFKMLQEGAFPVKVQSDTALGTAFFGKSTS